MVEMARVDGGEMIVRRRRSGCEGTKGRGPIWIALYLAIVCGTPGLAQSDEVRPKVGLVLSGGGARGAAHIGVLKVLEANRIPVDVIVGTSFGAIMGGLYASGLSAEELEAGVKSIDWTVALGSYAPRERRSFRRKQDDSNFLVKFRVGRKQGKLRLPEGFIQNENIRLILRQLLLNTEPAADFDDLPIPFRAVAAELESGEQVVLRDGSLVEAVLASAAVPGVFPPVEVDGKRLVDGGIANNVPIDAARALGAELLIVVDVSSIPRNEAEIDGVDDILDQMVTIMVYRNAKAQLKTLGPRDIVIRPELGDLGTTQFARSPDGIPLGERAALDELQALENLSISEADWANYTARRQGKLLNRRVLDFVEVENDSALDDRVIAEVLGIEKGDTLDPAMLDHRVQRVYGLDYFDTVDHEIVRRGGLTGLKVTARERASGADHFRFGLAVQDNFVGDATYNAAISYTDLGVNARGGEWRSIIQIGGDVAGVVTEFYQPIDYGQRYFALANFSFLQQEVSVTNADLVRIAEVRSRTARTRGVVGRNFGTWGALTVGFEYGFGDFTTRIGPPRLLEGNAEETTFAIGFDIDTFDSIHIPRRGVQLSVAFEDRMRILGGDTNGRSFEVGGFAAQSWGKNTVLVGGAFGTNLDDEETAADLFGFGGFLSMAGFSRDEVNGAHLTQATVMYYRQVAGHNTGLLSIPIYIGANFDVGNVWADLDDFAFRDLVYGGGLFLAAETVIGPVYFGSGLNSEGDVSVFLFLGQIF